MYATVANMVERFGNTEMVRLSMPEDRETETLDPAKIEVARRRHGTDRRLSARPLQGAARRVPKDIVRAACVLARYDLAKGSVPSRPNRCALNARKSLRLENIAKGLISIEAASAGNFGKSNGPRFSGRPAIFSDESLKGW